MKTLLTRSPRKAANLILKNELVAFPTETVYGLGASVFVEEAIQKVFIAKGRPADNPLIAHIADIDEIALLARSVTQAAEQFIEAFFPGPLTIVLRKSERVPDIATAGLETIGVRMPRLPAAQSFLKACGVPLVAPSANLSGRPSPTTWQAVRADLDGLISCILQGDQTEIGLESSVVDCTGCVPILLRAGAITIEQLRAVIPVTRFGEHDATTIAARSPGLKHRHYSPQARVITVAQPSEAAPALDDAAYIGIDAPSSAAAPKSFKRLLICQSVEEYARSLFHFFRQCDEANVKVIYCQTVEEIGLGTALMDRIKRAAQD